MAFMFLREAISAYRQKDPAARSWLEVLLCYPGLHAVLWHRLSHGLWRRRLHLPARVSAHLGRFLTGIEIHPAARIGRRALYRGGRRRRDERGEGGLTVAELLARQQRQTQGE